MTSVLQEFKHPKPTLTTDWTNYEMKHPHPRGKFKPVLQPFITGTKINTRNLEAYRTRGDELERLDIRKDNYERRQMQMECHGFNARKEKPYKGIGDPFYLDEDKLILHALGQLSEKEEEKVKSSSSDEDDIKISSKLKEPIGSSSSTQQFRLKRTRKDLHTIHKEVNHNRHVIRNVRLGHGLFDIIKQEQTSKEAAIEEAERLKLERRKTEWQPPKQESSSDEETDDELIDEVELSNDADVPTISLSFMNGDGKDTDEDIDDDAASDAESPEPRDKTVSSSVSFREDITSSPFNKAIIPMSRPATSASTKKKKQKIPRPYTPHFVNIMEEVKEKTGPSDALFRQLCALHWILEAMRNCDDSGIKMTPIMSCWKLINIGGVPTLEDVAIRDKEIDKDWKKFRDQDGHGTHRDRFNSRLYMQRRGTTTAKKPATWRTSLAGSAMGLSGTMRSSADEDDNHGDDDYKDDDSPSKIAIKNAFSKVFVLGSIGTSRMSVDIEGSKAGSEGATKTEDSIDKDESAAIEKWTNKVNEEKNKLAKTASELKRSTKVAKIEQLVRQSLNQTDKMPGRQDRADVHFIRPKSSPALMHFKNTRSSLKHGNMANKINTEFRRLQEEKALLLHEELEHREKQRMMICQNKFIAINSQRTTSFHKALRQMRERSDKLFIRPTNEQLKKKQMEEQGNWLTDLLRNVPEDLQNKWHYKHIIDKFKSKFGSTRRSSQRRPTVVQIEGFGQQHSKIKFLKVLERLREWEICSPDISAAIEFCREKIVKMSIEQFEEWFQGQFPKVIRPQTAPPVKKDDEKDDTSSKKQTPTSMAVPRRSASAYKKLIRPMTTG
ncbi:uncharacterized protein LOC143054359 isoform X3 [Mytilus galloprovincialis]|uniref:uncharacterized protein LOC143054359 isoform X3 n=1 Tax=Mytilus galloprovincialis TaxID=29158 RepID=UPI003F7B5BF7